MQHPPQQPGLPVVIVEPHHHALEEIHAVLRRQRRLGQSWSLVHVDAHPDLACPCGIPAVACFRPYDDDDAVSLYEMLDASTTGMAEWILPLVLAANLTHVEWIKPPVATQIPLGKHRFHVGVVEPTTTTTTPNASSITSYLDLSADAVVKVDWDCLYYRDDDQIDFYAPHASLHLAQPLTLHVLELWRASDDKDSGKSVNDVNHDTIDTQQPWILDICLDYFYTVNPFWADVQAMDEQLARISYQLVELATANDTAVEPVDRGTLLRFRQCLRNALQQLANDGNTDGSVLSASIQQLAPFMGEKTQQAHDLLSKWKELYMAHDDVQRARLLELIFESIPFALLPHSHFSSAVERHALAQALTHFQVGLQRRLARAVSPPFLITVARSMQDGFTPATLADYLQEHVLAILHAAFCGKDHCDNTTDADCRLQIRREYE